MCEHGSTFVHVKGNAHFFRISDIWSLKRKQFLLSCHFRTKKRDGRLYNCCWTTNRAENHDWGEKWEIHLFISLINSQVGRLNLGGGLKITVTPDVGEQWCCSVWSLFAQGAALARLNCVEDFSPGWIFDRDSDLSHEARGLILQPDKPILSCLTEEPISFTWVGILLGAGCSQEGWFHILYPHQEKMWLILNSLTLKCYLFTCNLGCNDDDMWHCAFFTWDL